MDPSESPILFSWNAASPDDPSPMKVAQFNFNDLRGGATRAAMRQHQALRSAGVESEVHVLAKETQDPEVIAFDYRAGLYERIVRRLRKSAVARNFSAYGASRPDGFELFSDDRVHLRSAVFRGLDEVDLVNLHWVAGYCDFTAIFVDLLALKPLVWTLHDMNAFTGGCHYDHGCGGFRDRCGACPQLGSRDAGDLSARVWERKRQALTGRSAVHHFCVAVPSRWLAEGARRSSLFRDARIEVIPYGLDTDLYRPSDRATARRKHGLTNQDRVILFLASGAGARRKGFGYLDEAVSGFDDREGLVVVSVGGDKPESSGVYRHLHLGTIAEEVALAEIYGAADLFVMPSIEDNLPLACQEALACGTPVIGFAVGGIPDMVIEGKTGFVVPPRNASAIGGAIRHFFADCGLASVLSRGAREHAVRHYSYSANASAYRILYDSLL
jgi:glycosyltransferase involved in cell wall biosynthesis